MSLRFALPMPCFSNSCLGLRNRGVIAAPNLNGDYLSDMAAAITDKMKTPFLCALCASEVIYKEFSMTSE